MKRRKSVYIFNNRCLSIKGGFELKPICAEMSPGQGSTDDKVLLYIYIINTQFGNQYQTALEDFKWPITALCGCIPCVWPDMSSRSNCHVFLNLPKLHSDLHFNRKLCFFKNLTSGYKLKRFRVLMVEGNSVMLSYMMAWRPSIAVLAETNVLK